MIQNNNIQQPQFFSSAGLFNSIPRDADNLYKHDAMKLIFSFLALPDAIHLMETCKELNQSGWTKVDFNQQNGKAISNAIKKSSLASIQKFKNLSSVNLSHKVQHTNPVINDLVEPIRLACIHGPLKLVQELLQDPNVSTSINVQDNDLILQASAAGHADIVQYLLDQGFSPNPADPQYAGLALAFACQSSNQDVVQILLKDGRSDPNAHTAQALLQACQYKDANVALEMVQLLVKDGKLTRPSKNQAIAFCNLPQINRPMIAAYLKTTLKT